MIGLLLSNLVLRYREWRSRKSEPSRVQVVKALWQQPVITRRSVQVGHLNLRVIRGGLRRIA